MTDITTGLKEAIVHIQDTSAAAKRDHLVTVDDQYGDTLTFLYNDGDKEYDEIDAYIPKSDTVSNVASFIRLVQAEAGRRLFTGGEDANIIFTSDGAYFTPTVHDRRDVYHYRRQLSVQWRALAEGLNKKMKHAEFILWLQKNRPSLGDAFGDVYQAFRVLSLNRASKLVSSPTLKDGQKGGSFEVQLEVKSGNAAGGSATTMIPEQITFTVPFARGDERTYAVPVLIDLDGQEGETPTIIAYAPELDIIRDKAIMDEMAEFTQAITDLPKLAVLLNF